MPSEFDVATCTLQLKVSRLLICSITCAMHTVCDVFQSAGKWKKMVGVLLFFSISYLDHMVRMCKRAPGVKTRFKSGGKAKQMM